jgi:pyruvate dehydrogenase E2 component (dihydrolipoamide acetyltransferase)
MKVPETNSSWMGTFIRRYKQVNMGISVKTPLGYVVPVIKNSNKKGILEIAKESKDLEARVANNTLTEEE